MCRFLLFVGRDPILLADLLTRPQHSIIKQSFDSRLRVDKVRPINGDGFGVGYYIADSRPSKSRAVATLDAPSAATSPIHTLPMQQLSMEESSTRVTVVGAHESLPSLRDQGSSEENSGKQMPSDTIAPNNTTLTIDCSMPKNPDAEEEMRLIRAYTMPGGPCIFTSILPAWNNLNLIRLSEKIKSHLVFAHVRAASPGFPIAETNCHPWCYGRFLWMHNGFISQFNKIKRKLQASLRDELFHFVQGNTDSEWTFALFLNQVLMKE
jgi:glutamine amidotransferase